MGARRVPHVLDAARLREVLAYDSLTGEFTWRLFRGNKAKVGAVAGRTNSRGYREIEVLGRSYNAHRLAWLWVTGRWPKFEIDHIDGSRGNNAIANLRDVPKNVNKQNQRTARKDSSSGLIGAYPTKAGKKWISRVCFGNTRLYLGTFDSPMAAHLAYVAEKRKVHEGCTI